MRRESSSLSSIEMGNHLVLPCDKADEAGSRSDFRVQRINKFPIRTAFHCNIDGGENYNVQNGR